MKTGPKKTLYFDCPTGISGDMCLGALIDLGFDVKKLKRELKKLPVKGYTITAKKEKRGAITGTRLRVKTEKERHHRTFKDISGLIEKSKLQPGVKKLSIAIFKTLAVAEGRVHGIPASKVHFHEVGAVDSIVDIVGAAIGVTDLKIDRFHSSGPALGSGWVNTEHGRLPVPAPATLELVSGMPVLPSPIKAELTTPTGASILKTLVTDFGPIPPMVVEKTGSGVGGKDFKDAPNIMRLILGEARPLMSASRDNTLIQIETNIDDMNPQTAPYIMERLFQAGAVEVFFTPIQMKKSRPGLLLTVLAEEEIKGTLLEIIFTESTSIGVRCHSVQRHCLERKSIRVKTKYGPVRVKVSFLDGIPVNRQPEYEEVLALARLTGVPLKEVMVAARAAADKSKKK